MMTMISIHTDKFKINIKSVFFTVSVYFISRTNLILEGVSVIHILFGCLFVLAGDIKVLHVSVQSGGNSDTRQDTHDWSQDQHQTDHDTLQNIKVVELRLYKI